MNQKKPKLLQDQRGIVLILEVFIALLVVGGISFVSYRLYQAKNSKQEANNSVSTSSKSNSQDDKFEVVEAGSTKTKPGTDDLEGTIMRFTSPSLGITFTHLDNWKSKDGQRAGDAKIVRNGNKVCIGSESDGENICEKGQTVEVFSKKPEQSIKAAIEEQVLKNHSKTDCFVQNKADDNKMLGSGDEKAEIAYPHKESDNDPFSELTASKCPADYRKTAGLRYFVIFKDHPDKFAFLSIGQYAIPADTDNKTWQQTLEFID